MKPQLRINFSFVTLLTLMSIFGSASVHAQAQQEHVHNMSHNVMPFDMAKTVHIFKMTESGGIQKVIAKDTADTDQIALICSSSDLI